MIGPVLQSGFAQGMGLIQRGIAMIAEENIDAIAPVELGSDIKSITSAIDRLELQRARRIDVFDRDGGYSATGDGTAANWLRRNCSMPGHLADRQVKFARQLNDLEETQKAVESGRIGMQHALEIARATDDMGVGAEPALLEAATQNDPGELRHVARDLRHRADSSDLARLAEEQRRRRALRLYALPDGMIGVEGALPPETGTAFKLCLDSLIGIPAKGDKRTQQQRNADALMDLCSRQLDSGKLPRIGGRRPHLMVTATVEALSGEPGAPAPRLEGYGPISAETARRLTSGGTVSVLTLDRQGVILDYGQARRLASEPQRRVVAARTNGCCGVRGCDRPAKDCEIHHLDEVYLGGRTDVKRMVLLCRAEHHPLVHEGGWKLELQSDGTMVPIPP